MTPTIELILRCRRMSEQILSDGPAKRLFAEIVERLEKQHSALALVQPFLKGMESETEAKIHLDRITDLLRVN